MKLRSLAVALSLLALAGCSSAGATPASDPLATPSAPSNGTMPDDVWLAMVRDDVPFYVTVPADLVIRDARMMCGTFNPSKGGAAMTQFGMAIKVLSALGLEASDTGAFLTYATAQYCPVEMSLIPRA